MKHRQAEEATASFSTKQQQNMMKTMTPANECEYSITSFIHSSDDHHMHKEQGTSPTLCNKMQQQYQLINKTKGGGAHRGRGG